MTAGMLPAVLAFRRSGVPGSFHDTMPPRPLLRRALRRAGLLGLTTLSVVACEKPRPNVVVVVVDTLRQDRVSAYGYERQTTPHLDRLAAEGARLDGLSPTSWTKPATASLLTGLHPLRHQAFARGDVLPESATSLAQVLAGRGYATVAVSANSWISRAWGFERGFGHFYLMKNLGYGHHAKAHQVAKVAREHLAELVPPYFLYLHLVDPHAPYDPAKAWDGGPLPPEVEAFRPLTDQKLLPHSWRQRPPDVMRALVDLYDGEVHHVDQELGALLAELRDHDTEGRGTVLVVTSDHGEELGDHGRIGHGHTLYRETTAVPLLIHAPGRVPAGRVLGRASLLDVVPTVLELAGLADEIPKLGTLDGRSLVPWLQSGDEGQGEPAPARLLHLDFDSGHGLAYLEGDQKLLLSKGPYAKQVFDLAADPGERHDRFAELAEPERGRLALELARNYNQLSRDALPRRTTTIDQELAASIRALGYVAFSTDRGDARILPGRIKPADDVPGGLLGWQGDESLDTCLALGVRSAEPQLLAGWFDGERREGRWSAPVARVAMPLSPRATNYRLRLEGMSYRTTAFDLEASAAGQVLLTMRGVPPGPFAQEASVELPAGASTPLFLDLRVTPPFVPAEEMDSVDYRVLGAFLTRLCLEPR